MSSGRLKHRILIQEPIESKGLMGGTAKQWVLFHKSWGNVIELSGKEVVQSDQLSTRIIATCFLRYRKKIDSSMRLIHDNNIYQIESVINKDGKKKMLELLLYEFR